MQKYKLTIAYDGTAYSGWQIQNNAVSIQSLLEAALSTILRTPTPVVASGRTDAGVHAKGQVAHFISATTPDLKKLHLSLNGILPDDIRILSVENAAPDFHARYSAISKEYHYHLHLERTTDPFKRLYSYQDYSPLDLEKMKLAIKYFIGTHDFTTFANEASGKTPRGSAAKNPIRTIIRLTICEEPGGIRLEFEGDGFLYKMVRNITGTLLEVARGKIAVESIPELFKAKDRTVAPPAAPSRGLFLVKVNY
ncbi:MAG TPA: tRNA pseudouridine(38-40) synthase TruA [Rhabdochlamydiaceae bacterium]|jgi:tRNA pseudouridine38-40 synthase|nr:tRNA pseudouridine(38-40) synthase TruA [Rhabdochlamydiaceae bacterium]